MIQQSDLRSIVAQILKLDEFAVDEGKLWARLVEWSAVAVRKPELLGPYADATGECVKRSRTYADDTALGAHEMEQQRAILKQMSQHIRFGAMSKDFFVDKARMFLTREESEEIIDFFLLGRKPQRLMVSPRTGLVQEITSFPITVNEVREWVGDFLPCSLGATASLSTTLAQGNGDWTPRYHGLNPLTKLEVKLHQQLRISSVRLTFAPNGAICLITVMPSCTIVTSERIVDCKVVSDFFGDTLEIVPLYASNPAALTKIEVFGSCFKYVFILIRSDMLGNLCLICLHEPF